MLLSHSSSEEGSSSVAWNAKSKFLCSVLQGPPPGGPFLQGLLLSNPQQFSTLNTQKNICGNKEGRRRGRGRTTNVFFRECRNPCSVPQSTFSISDKYMEFYLMICHLSGNNFFRDINILGGSTLVKQFTHQYSPEGNLGARTRDGMQTCEKKK